MTTNRVSNSSYKIRPEFIKACEQAAKRINPNNPELSLTLATRRQASKYRRKTGIVWKTLNNMV